MPGAGAAGNMPMHPQFGYHSMAMGGAGANMPFMNAGMGGGPPFMPPGPPVNPPSSGAASHHVPPGSGSVLLVSNLDPEVCLLPEHRSSRTCNLVRSLVLESMYLSVCYLNTLSWQHALKKLARVSVNLVRVFSGAGFLHAIEHSSIPAQELSGT